MSLPTARNSRPFLAVAFALLALFLPFAASADMKAVEGAEKTRVAAAIDRSLQSTNTLRCKFTQTKSLKMMKRRLVSTGTMAFSSPGKLRWHYDKPSDYTFIIADGKVKIASPAGTQTTDTAQNRMMGRIADLILESVTGRCLTSSNDFSVSLLETGSGEKAVRLIPLRKEMKQMMTEVLVVFSKGEQYVESVTITDPQGDTTLIEFEDVERNVTLSPSLFAVD